MLSAFRTTLNTLPRGWKRALLIASDLVVLNLIMWLSYQLRIGSSFAPSFVQWLLMLLAPLVALPIFVRMGLYRAVIRYLPERAIWTILQAMVLATLAWVFLLFLAEATRFGFLPRTVPIFYFLLGTIAVAGTRFAAKSLLWSPSRPKLSRGEVAIYGAGAAGTQLANALRGQGSHYVAGFVDDDRNLWGRDVSGIRVYPPHRLDALIRDYGVREVIISMPSIDASRRSAIFSELSKHHVMMRALPDISEIATGKYIVSQLREIEIDDLLGRSSVPADPQLLQSMIAGKTILVSGGGGSIGSELCRIIARLNPKKLIVLEANEFALYQIERQLVADAEFPVVPVLGSVADEPLVRRTLEAHHVDAVFHAAAHKHVPLVEANALEGVRNNVLGSEVIARVAFESGVRNFVLISTDKAVRPTNVMGATKRWAEMLVGHYADRARHEQTGQRFVAVRFGNVLGSNGSVVPLFREQIARGGPVTLTDERMTRYFMSIHEAAELIVQAGALSEGGEIFLLEMGEPVRIRDLAENMIRLAGFRVKTESEPDGDIEINVTGMRPGEKLYEEMFYDPAEAEPTRKSKILRSTTGERSAADVVAGLAEIKAALAAENESEVRRILFALIEEQPQPAPHATTAPQPSVASLH